VEGLGVPGPAAAAVSLCSVGVSFPGRPAPVLVGADLVVAPGETVALVGPSGAGKSTVISLLAGALAPNAGTVMVGGADLAGLDLRQWRRLVAWLPEHPSMLSMSLAANLRLARPEAGDDELLEALARVGADQVVARLPLGLATPLGEGGQVLSAGELQRVALARVALRPAQLYLLDEPTVHLDRAGEERALAGLRRAMAGSSALVVTHSRAVAAAADRVVTLVDGRLVAPSSDTRHALVRA
jgi:ATP-binding cassette subfamily C protein CydCD